MGFASATLARRRLLASAAKGALAAPGALGLFAAACSPKGAADVLRPPSLPTDSAAVFQALQPGRPPGALAAPDSPWDWQADPPATLELTAEGMRFVSAPGARVWTSPQLPVAPLNGAKPGQHEELTWDATVTVARAFFIVCELRFAGEPGAVLIQAGRTDMQVFDDSQRPGGGTSRSVSRTVGDAKQHLWRLRLTSESTELRLDGSAVWQLPGPHALSYVSFGESRTDSEHGGTMLLRDVIYVRRPA